MRDKNYVGAVQGHTGGQFGEVGVIAELDAAGCAVHLEKRNARTGGIECLFGGCQVEFAVGGQVSAGAGCQVYDIEFAGSVFFSHAGQDGQPGFFGKFQ